MTNTCLPADHFRLHRVERDRDLFRGDAQETANANNYQLDSSVLVEYEIGDFADLLAVLAIDGRAEKVGAEHLRVVLHLHES